MRKMYASIILFMLISKTCVTAGNLIQQNVLTVEPYLETASIRPGDSIDMLLILTIRPGYHINAHKPLEDFYIPTEAKIVQRDNIVVQNILYPKAELKNFAFSTEKLAVYEEKLAIKVSILVGDSAQQQDLEISGSITYQACTDQSCLAPDEAQFSIIVKVVQKDTDVVYINKEIFEKYSDIVGERNMEDQTSDVSVEFTSDELRAKAIIEKGLPYAIIAFFVLGLALNLTPCVYPILPITVSYFGGRTIENKKSGFISALFYVLGIAVVFSMLGLISGLAGQQWGFLFQKPWFSAVIALIILSMAASMFGAFEIVVPSWLLTKLGSAREGVVGALVMGLTVGVVIAPCAAGIIIGLVGLVAKLGIVAKGALLFFIMGLGLGLPYLFLATFSSLLSKLPKSGMWMLWIRKFFGILLVGVAIYFILPQAKLVNNQLAFFIGLLAMFGGLLLGLLDQTAGYTKNFNMGRAIFGIAIIIFGAFIFNNALHSQASTIKWIEYRNEQLSEFTQQEKPIFIDFYADWCAPCKQMERTTFRDDLVTELSQEFLMLKVNCTSPIPAIHAFMEVFNVVGMPTFVFIDTKGNELAELRKTGYINPKQFAALLEKTIKGK